MAMWGAEAPKVGQGGSARRGARIPWPNRVVSCCHRPTKRFRSPAVIRCAHNGIPNALCRFRTKIVTYHLTGKIADNHSASGDLSIFGSHEPSLKQTK